jgi:hypothetical protein
MTEKFGMRPGDLPRSGIVTVAVEFIPRDGMLPRPVHQASTHEKSGVALADSLPAALHNLAEVFVSDPECPQAPVPPQSGVALEDSLATALQNLTEFPRRVHQLSTINP